MERNDCDLSVIYEMFQKLISYYEDDGLLGLVLERCTSILLPTESIGISFILNPANIDKKWLEPIN